MAAVGEILQKYGQHHVLEMLSAGKQYPMLEKIDLEKLLKHARPSALSQLSDNAKVSFDTIEALPVETVQSIAGRKEALYRLGMALLMEQKLAVVILSGGQGSRLGYHHAKGMFDVGITRSVSIFELLVNRLSRLSGEIGAPIPLFLMTSRENHGEIQQFFDRHGYFGYAKDFVEFFVQNEFPALDADGNLFLTRDKELLMLPSGNGDWYDALTKSGILEKPQYRNVEWLNVVSVDNPLQYMADPVFLGATLASTCNVGAKVIRKAAPEEKVGIVCSVEGRPGIIEYYDVPEAIRYEKTESGEYKYQYGVTLNYLFRRAALDTYRNAELPLHYVRKSVQVGDDNLVLKKAETLILDNISFFDSLCAYEIVREREFAPIKNRSGVDSVETARALLEANGICL